MKKILIYLFIIIVMWNAPVWAVPKLQLDIGGGVYDPDTETIKATDSSFTLYAILTTKALQPLDDFYYISAALVPKAEPDSAASGSFVINNTLFTVSDNLAYGSPPFKDDDNGLFDPKDLPSHGIFETYFTEVEFKFNANHKIGTYNTQDHPGGFGLFDPLLVGTSYYAAFQVDTSGLDPDYIVHFDLYSLVVKNPKKNPKDYDIKYFAPFSHDAESAPPVLASPPVERALPVPEPASMLLLGTGLIGMTGLGRKKFIDK